MSIIKKDGILKTHFFIAVVILFSLWGCGSGGVGGSGSGTNELVASGSGGSADLVDNGGGNNSDPDGDNGSAPVPDPTTNSSVTISWNSPQSNSDGTALNDLAGYKIYYGTSSNVYTQSVDVGNITSAVISSLTSGNWCFATTAYDTAGNESNYSNEVCKTI
ncbi:MAG: fibronectin type III domain-containing protein [Nitrospirota bacterium]